MTDVQQFSSHRKIFAMKNRLLSTLALFVLLFITPHNFTTACCTCVPTILSSRTSIWGVETLKSLKCSNCMELPTYSIPLSVTELDLSSGNKFPHLTTSFFEKEGLINLKVINLTNCGIEKFDEYALLGIKRIWNVKLDLSYNSLSSMYMVTMCVSDLNLRGNPIKDLIFQKVGCVQGLDLSNCSMDTIPTNGPFVDTALQKLNLDSNNLTSLSWRHFQGVHSLIYLSLRDNPWRCDCHIHFLREHLIKTRTMDISDDVVCESPHELKGRGLASIPRSQVLPCPLKIRGVVGTTSMDNVTVRCFTEGVPEPDIKWYQEKYYLLDR